MGGGTGTYRCRPTRRIVRVTRHITSRFSGWRAVRSARAGRLCCRLRYAELKDAATAVTRAEEWLDTVAATRNDNADGTGSLRALELLALRRRAFVQIARDYNRRIARYSELAAPGQISAGRLTGMLIKFQRIDDRNASGLPAPPRSRQSSSESPPRTFVEDRSARRESGSPRVPCAKKSVQPASANIAAA